MANQGWDLNQATTTPQHVGRSSRKPVVLTLLSEQPVPAYFPTIQARNITFYVKESSLPLYL